MSGMTMARFIGAVIALPLLAGSCGSDPVLPANAVVGQWGGLNFDLTASAAGATLRIRCHKVDIEQSIIADPEDGSFHFEGIARGSGNTASVAVPTDIHGWLSADRSELHLTASHLTSDDGEELITFSGTRGEQGRFNAGCLT